MPFLRIEYGQPDAPISCEQATTRDDRRVNGDHLVIGAEAVATGIRGRTGAFALVHWDRRISLAKIGAG